MQSGSQDLGTGTFTVMTQVAADALGLPPDKVRLRTRRHRLPRGRPSPAALQSVASVAPRRAGGGYGGAAGPGESWLLPPIRHHRCQAQRRRMSTLSTAGCSKDPTRRGANRWRPRSPAAAGSSIEAR
ncbi:molybdopterin cofactor-binding domain-containing protein [Cupriavidus basilensis]